MKVSYLAGAFLAALLSGCVGSDKDYAELSIPASLSVTEPESGDVEFTIPFTLDRAGDDSPFKVNIQLNHISTSDSDVQLITSNEIIFDGVSDVAEIQLLIRSDSLKEPTEKFAVAITSDDVTIIGGKTVVEIIDSTPVTVIGFVNETYTISEGVGAQNVAINIQNPPEKDDVLLTFSFSGTATFSEDGISGDYTVGGSQIIVPAGLTTVNLPITVLSDDKPEGGESIIITMFAPGREVSTNVATVFIPGDLVMNDTGVVEFFNGTGFQNTSSSDFPKQDADYGLDVGASDTDGHAGFRLTRLDFAGNAVSQGSPFRCVKDENVGLIWEVKQGVSTTPVNNSGKSYSEFIGDLVRLSQLEKDDPNYSPYPYNANHADWQSVNYSYYWLNEDSSKNGGSPGTSGSNGFSGYMMTEYCAFPNISQIGYLGSVGNCTNKDYSEYMNAFAVCGIKDWRLPTINELRSIVNYNPNDEALDQSYFPLMSGKRYMSSTPYGREKGSYWCLDTATKEAKLCNKQVSSSIMLVRGIE